MVRLSVGYGALLHPFVDSKGNFGKVYSRDMACAAPRAIPRRSWRRSARILFRDLDQDAVDFVDNYDNTMKEPALLPTTFPNILVSANQGIAVGMASAAVRLQPGRGVRHHGGLSEKPGRASLSDTLLPPDFPTGGELICDSARPARASTRTGRGSVISVRARWRYDKKATTSLRSTRSPTPPRARPSWTRWPS